MYDIFDKGCNMFSWPANLIAGGAWQAEFHLRVSSFAFWLVCNSSASQLVVLERAYACVYNLTCASP